MSKHTGGAGADGDLQQPRKRGFSEQLLVWFLVVMVGVLFGMGPAVLAIKAPGPGEILEVSATDTQRMVTTHNRLARIREGGRGLTPEQAALQIRFARQAEAEGLMPKGAALEEVMRDFLSQQTREGRSLRALLEDYRGSDLSVEPEDLEWYLQIQQAADNLVFRRAVVPAVPDRASLAFKRALRDQVAITMVTLDTAPFLEAHREAAAADELAIEAAYSELRDRWFRIPAQRELTVFAVEAATIAELVAIPEEDIAPWYEANREGRFDWRLPPEPTDEGDEAEAEDAATDAEEAADDAESEEPPEPRYKPLAEVRDQVVEAMRRERALPLARRLLAEFEGRVQEIVVGAGGSEARIPLAALQEAAAASVLTPADHPQLTAPATVRVVSDFVIEEDLDRSAEQVVDLGEFTASARFDHDPFDPETAPGLVELPGGLPDGLGLVTHYGAYTEQRYQPLAEVRDQVITYRAGRAAWPDLRAEAAELARRAAAHEGGLAGLFADQELVERLGAEVDDREVGVLAQVTPPPEQPDGASGVGEESYPVMVLATDARPVRLMAAAEASDAEGIAAALPRLNLIQVDRYIPAEERPPRGQGDFMWSVPGYVSGQFRQAVGIYLFMQAEQNVRSQLAGG